MVGIIWRLYHWHGWQLGGKTQRQRSAWTQPENLITVSSCGVGSSQHGGQVLGSVLQESNVPKSHTDFYDSVLGATQHHSHHSLLVKAVTNHPRFKGRGHRVHLSVRRLSECLWPFLKPPQFTLWPKAIYLHSSRMQNTLTPCKPHPQVLSCYGPGLRFKVQNLNPVSKPGTAAGETPQVQSLVWLWVGLLLIWRPANVYTFELMFLCFDRDLQAKGNLGLIYKSQLFTYRTVCTTQKYLKSKIWTNNDSVILK